MVVLFLPILLFRKQFYLYHLLVCVRRLVVVTELFESDIS